MIFHFAQRSLRFLYFFITWQRFGCFFCLLLAFCPFGCSVNCVHCLQIHGHLHRIMFLMRWHFPVIQCWFSASLSEYFNDFYVPKKPRILCNFMFKTVLLNFFVNRCPSCYPCFSCLGVFLFCFGLYSLTNHLWFFTG